MEVEFLTQRRINRKRVAYFIPWWDDLVYLHYDFHTDEPIDAVKVTSHELYDSPPYDGILVSKVKIEDNKTRLKDVIEKGIHTYLKFNGPVFGDCGAYGYINEKEPPFNPSKIADYYQELGFDYGVSVDHLIVKSVEDEKEHRFDITIRNAEKFLQRHQEKGYDFVPVGAAQGWDERSYAEGITELLDMGYKYLAIGGLTRSQTPYVLQIMRAVKDAVEDHPDIGIHLFGVARLNAIRELWDLGLTSFDSASHLRRAWLGANTNYILPGGVGYAALRVPQSDKSPKAREIIEEHNMTIDELKEYEDACLSLIRAYDKDEANLDEVLEALLWYDSLMGDKRRHAKQYTRTLKDKPWRQCECRICNEWGVEVIIFRGNNRNRRRGFHNTRIFYDELQKLLDTKKTHIQQRLDEL